VLFFAIQVSKAKRSCAFTEGSASFRSSNSADTEMVGSASTGAACTSVAPYTAFTSPPEIISWQAERRLRDGIAE